MKNAHLRMGKLIFTRQTRETVTNVSLHLHRMIAEPLSEPHASAQLHLISAFGGDQEAGACVAAAQQGLRFQIATPGEHITGTLGEKPAIYRSSIQIPGRKRPVRHLVMLSQEMAATALGADGEARRTVLVDDSPPFVLHRLSVRFGIPVLSEWADWFFRELERRKAVEPLLGLNCAPIVVNATKLRLLRVLSLGLKRKTIQISGQ